MFLVGWVVEKRYKEERKKFRHNLLTYLSLHHCSCSKYKQPKATSVKIIISTKVQKFLSAYYVIVRHLGKDLPVLFWLWGEMIVQNPVCSIRSMKSPVLPEPIREIEAGFVGSKCSYFIILDCQSLNWIRCMSELKNRKFPRFFFPNQLTLGLL